MKAVEFNKCEFGTVDKDNWYICMDMGANYEDMSGTYYKAEDVKELVEAAESILKEYSDTEVMMSTPIAYFRKFDKLKDLIQKFES